MGFVTWEQLAIIGLLMIVYLFIRSRVPVISEQKPDLESEEEE